MKRLSGWDAVALYGETPNVHMHTLKIGVVDARGVDEHFDVEFLRRVSRGGIDRLDPLRFELIDIPMKIHHPMWREHCDVDLDYHIRSCRVASPGGRRQLNEVIGRIASTPLDRSRPPWEVHLVEGLADGRVALVGKVHHALADGVASGNLLARAMGMSAESQFDPVSYVADPIPSRSQLVRAALRDHIRQLAKLPGTISYTAAGIRRVRRSDRQGSTKPGRAPSAPPTFINHVIDSRRRFATATLALADVKETSRHLEVTINDLVLAIAAGGLRQLLLRYDGTADHPLLAGVPVSIDVTSERIWGNHFSAIRVPLPADDADPLQRIRRSHDAAASAKASHELLGPELVSRWAAYLPPAAAETLSRWLSRREGQNKLLNLPISNVRGPRERGHIGGAVVTEIYSVGPLSAGSGLNITVWSYVDQLNISVLADGETLGDPHELTDAMVEDFREIRTAAGLSADLTIVEIAMPH